MAISPEFRLAVECCHRCFRGTALEPERLALPDIDWPRFQELVCFHRIEGLAWDALKNFDLPVAVRTGLKNAATAITAKNLRTAAQCRVLLERFGEADIPLLFLKGLTLAALAYRNPSLKAAVDIDLLIRPEDLEGATRLLRENGYRLAAPRNDLTDPQLRSWHRLSKESTWTNPKLGLQVDLHTRITDNTRILPRMGMGSDWQFVEVAPGIELPTLAPDELFAYLAVHGASSTWFRLKWISDFAAILDNQGPMEIARKYDLSQEYGAGRAAGQALLLADELFGTLDENASLREELSTDAQTLRLLRSAFSMVTGAPVEPTSRRFGTLPIHWTQLLLLPSLKFKLSEITRQAATALRSRG